MHNAEEWLDIKGFEGFYKISNYGRLKSYKQFEHGKILKLTNKNGDYFSVVLTGNGKTKSTRIHRLVAEHFLVNPLNYPYVNHIDGNKQNNHIINLEWCSQSENVRHSVSMHYDQLKPMINYNQLIKTRKICQYDLQGNFLKCHRNGAEAARATGVCQRNILQVANKTPFNEKGYFRKTAGGYMWRFEDEVKNA